MRLGSATDKESAPTPGAMNRALAVHREALEISNAFHTSTPSGPARGRTGQRLGQARSPIFVACARHLNLSWAVALIVVGSSLRVLATDSPPSKWLDPDTGHRIVRLTTEPGSESLYFHQNPFTPDGTKMVFTAPSGISTVDLTTHKTDLVVPADPNEHNSVSGIVVGRKQPNVYYVKRVGEDLVAFVTDLNSHATRRIGKISGNRGSLMAVNSDETLLAGSFVEDTPENRLKSEQIARHPGESKGAWMVRRFESGPTMQLFTLNTKTGKVKTFNRSTSWLNHVQFSPTNPNQLMFCHEGPWHLVDRTWLIRADGSGLTKVQPRIMKMEIEGHEFFGPDGKWAWYDLQTPRGEDFWLGGYEIATGERIWYHLTRDEWSVHFNVSPDGKLFAGDGGGPGNVAHAKDGKWIYLFRPKEIHIPAGPKPEGGQLITPGVFEAERLVNMSKHNYSLEPNVHFTPDGKWIVFRSNMFGPSYVFEVEIAKANGL